MSLRVALGMACLTVAASVGAQNAPADPVITHFREYRAALDRGDNAAAEVAARAAYDASEAANGPRTAVLAFNLATLRLDMNKPAEAYAPAKRAQELAAANPDSGVDPVMAAIVLGRAALAVDGMSAAPALLDAISKAERGGLHSDAHFAAVELAGTAFNARDYEMARTAWGTAARTASKGSNEPQFARGLARAGEGTAIFMQAVRDTTARGIARGDARDANEAFTEALSLLRPMAEGGDPGVLTYAQGVYAQALAWQGALRAKLEAQGDELPGGSAPAAGNQCALRLVAQPEPSYTSEALQGLGVGAAVVRITTDAEGAVVARQLAAVIPGGVFSNAILAVADRWAVEPAPNPARGCRRDGTQFTPIVFVAP